MPIKKSGFKRLRQDNKKHEHNKAILSELKSLKKKTLTSIASKNREEADALLKKLESKMDRAARKNIIKKNNAARNIARMRKQWAAIEK
ncbi:MAG: 30S ribosomal protein S20 [Candidatus Omnitrophota bacterium]